MKKNSTSLTAKSGPPFAEKQNRKGVGHPGRFRLKGDPPARAQCILESDDRKAGDSLKMAHICRYHGKA